MSDVIWIDRHCELGQVAVRLEDCVRYILRDDPDPPDFKQVLISSDEEWFRYFRPDPEFPGDYISDELEGDSATYKLILYNTPRGEWLAFKRGIEVEDLHVAESEYTCPKCNKPIAFAYDITEYYHWMPKAIAARHIFKKFENVPKELAEFREIVTTEESLEAYLLDSLKYRSWDANKRSGHHNLTACQRDCLDLIESAGRRMSTTEILRALDREGWLHGESTVKLALRDLTQMLGILNNKTDERGRGYGPADW